MKGRLLLCGLCLNSLVFATDSNAYLEKFETYLSLSQNLPDKATPELISFIKQNSPLAHQLRKKWLYSLGKNKEWDTYNRFYQQTSNIELQCFALTAKYHLGQQKEALKSAESIWLYGGSRPAECDELLKLLLNSQNFNETLLTKRVVLALEKRNLSLARYLLKQYNPPRLGDIKRLNQIYRKPSIITQLETGKLHDDFYLYGLKRMVSIDMDSAIQFFQHVKTHKLLSDAQQQSFLVHAALYKAIRNHEDTLSWFDKIKPAYHNEALINWQIRFALKRQLWHKVIHLINLLPDQDNPSWQYWKARALEAQGLSQPASTIYEKLAKTRNYYGFLASIKLKKPLQFENEPPVADIKPLKPYQPILELIRELYDSKQQLTASRLVNDFVLELSKKERSALAFWLAADLKWVGKSLYISNSDELLHDQLILRFPLAHRPIIQQNAKQYNIPEPFIFAIIRQESTFRENVVSTAGALGLMQVMPNTAKMVAKKAGITYKNKKQLFIVPKNIRMGTAYLQQLSEQFKNHPVLMAAAYNAGPRQVKRWHKAHTSEPVDIWIETLPWHETRNYLKNVIAFYAVYQYLIQETPDISDFMKPLS